MIKSLAIIHLTWAFVVALVMFFVRGEGSALSCLVAGVLSTANLYLLFIVWNFIFNKKLIALTTLVIIFKYLILGVILILISRQSWVDPIGFIAGVSTLALAIFSMMLLKQKS